MLWTMTSNFEIVQDALVAAGIAAVAASDVDGPQGCATIGIDIEEGGLDRVVDLVRALAPRAVLMSEGLHGSLSLHAVAEPWVHVVAVTAEATAELEANALRAARIDERVDDLAEKAEALVSQIPVSKHASGPWDIAREVVAAVVSGEDEAEAQEVARGVAARLRESDFWFDDLRLRHAEWIRENAVDLAARILGDRPQPAGRVSKPTQRQTVREWMKALDPCCVTLPVIEPVVVAFGELLDARP